MPHVRAAEFEPLILLKIQHLVDRFWNDGEFVANLIYLAGPEITIMCIYRSWSNKIA